MHRHFHRPTELPFTAQERSRVTILIGGLTMAHERMIVAAFLGNGYKCHAVPQPDRAAHELGREYCSNNLCNPVYFTVGSLLSHLRALEASGLSRSDIVQDYLFVTAGSGGPCRFGMYEAEFRAALEAAGYHGFRILLFNQDHGIGAKSGHAGLRFNVDFGMDMMDAVILGDLLNILRRRLMSYEAVPGTAQKVLDSLSSEIAEHFLEDKPFELKQAFTGQVVAKLTGDEQSRCYRIPNTLGKVHSHLYGHTLTDRLRLCHERLAHVEVDWLRVRPVVKVIGEFWAQMTESDGNFRMFEFLEREGAEVLVEPISTWLMYLLYQAKARGSYRRKMQIASEPIRPLKILSGQAKYLGKRALFSLGEHLYAAHYKRLSNALGMPQKLLSQRTMARLADPHYSTFLRGGEGHLEIGKNLYYTSHKGAHMVLALKPFGCLPSTQSDGVQAALVEQYPEMSFLSVETSADGEVHAYSRVQMALAEARARATVEFNEALRATHRSVEELRKFVQERPELRHPLCAIPRRAEVVSTAANFVYYLDDLLSTCTQRETTAEDSLLSGFPNQAIGSKSEVHDV